MSVGAQFVADRLGDARGRAHLWLAYATNTLLDIGSAPASGVATVGTATGQGAWCSIVWLTEPSIRPGEAAAAAGPDDQELGIGGPLEQQFGRMTGHLDQLGGPHLSCARTAAVRS